MFRFEYFENVISKHHLSNVTWKTAAESKANNPAGTICHVRMVDDDTFEIIKRKDVKVPIFFKWGVDQTGVFERVTINRKECTVAIDRMDKSWRVKEPFLGQRDLFYIERKDKDAILNMTANKDRLAFVRHDFWLHKLWKFNAVFGSHWAAWSHKRGFTAYEAQKKKLEAK